MAYSGMMCRYQIICFGKSYMIAVVTKRRSTVSVCVADSHLVRSLTNCKAERAIVNGETEELYISLINTADYILRTGMVEAADWQLSLGRGL
jgi:hypothetical protein